MTAPLPELAMIVPELVLAVGAMLLLMLGAFSGERSAPAVNLLAIVVLAIAAIAVLGGNEDGIVLSGAYVVDGFARFMKVAALAGSAVAIIMAWRFARVEGVFPVEYPKHEQRHGENRKHDLRKNRRRTCLLKKRHSLLPIAALQPQAVARQRRRS